MKTSIIWIACGLLFSGCSVYEAAHAPPSVEYKHVRFGETRAETIAHLGLPKMSEKKGDEQTDYFEFFDGYHPASKARIILYVAGDVFTACLAEVIWWPLEMAVFEGKLCRGTVKYGPENLVKSYEIRDKKGNPLWVGPVAASPPSPVTAVPARKTVPAKPPATQKMP